MNRCARSCSHWSRDAWRMAKYQKPRVKSYPLPDPGIRHRCVVSVLMCLDWRLTANLLTHLRLPHGAAIPTIALHEPWTFSSQIPSSNDCFPEVLHSFLYSPSPAIPLHTPAPRHPPKPLTWGGKHVVWWGFKLCVSVQVTVSLCPGLVPPCAQQFLFIIYQILCRPTTHTPGKKKRFCPSSKIFSYI